MTSQSSDDVIICFATPRQRAAYEELKGARRSEDKLLYKKISDAIDTLKERPRAGIHIAQHLVPKEYLRDYGSKRTYLVYRLSDSLRLTYILAGKDGVRYVILIEWMTHGEYEERFGYHKT